MQGKTIPDEGVAGGASTLWRGLTDGSKSLAELEAASGLEKVRFRCETDLREAVEDVAQGWRRPVLGLPTMKS